MEYLNKNEVAKFWRNLPEADQAAAFIYISKRFDVHIVHGNPERETRITKDAIPVFSIRAVGSMMGGYKFQITGLN